MEPSGEYFGEDFGQKIDLTVRIREILRNYPEGTSILKELVQNADDAGAREVRLCLDLRQHGTAGLPSPALAQFQGPALLVFNDGVFTDTDFRSIQRIGDSLKKDTSKGGKTGRFGIGFNSVYHLTELPAFVSAGKWCSFDPQAKFLPNVNPANPGKMVDFIRYPETVQRYPDQFSPLSAFGCNLRSNFPATLFRFPLRTPEQASVSRLSRQAHGVADMRGLLQAFARESAGMLLFLKNVERMSVFEWSPGQGEPKQVHATFVPSPSAALRRSRAFALSATPEKLAGGGATTADYVLDLVSQPAQGNGVSEVRERWQVCNQLGGPRATAIAGSEKAKFMKFVPWAGVAARLSTTAAAVASPVDGEGSEPLPPAPRGAAYCFLPLPVQTGLPVHVNGYFELSSNRRDIWSGSDMVGDGALRANWNKALVEELAASCYTRVLLAAKAVLGGGAAYEAMWPTGPTAEGSMWRCLADSLMRLVRPLPLLRTRSAVPGGWVAPQKCVVWTAGGVSGENGGGRGGDEREQRALAEVLLAEKIPLVEGSRELRSLLLSSGCANYSTTPAFVRHLFKSLASRPAGSGGGVGANGSVSLRAGNPKARSNCILLLHYCLEDLGAGRGPGHGFRGGGTSTTSGGSGDTGGYKELAGLPLVPLVDGSHGVFRSSTAVDAQKLELIRGMGFSEARARQALARHEQVQAAVEWLSGGGGDDRGDAAERLFVLCGEEEARLLSGAGASLISEASLSEKSGALSGGGGEGQAGGAVAAPAERTPGVEDDGRVLRALRSSSLQSALNVTAIRDDLLPDLIGQTLPAAWRGGGSSTASATAFPWTPGKAGHPDVDWFRRLWGYLALSRPSAVRLLAESFPVVPTGNMAVCPLSLRSAVIDGARLGGDVRSMLVKAGCRTLLPGVFAGSGEDAATLTAPPSAGGDPKVAGGQRPAAAEAGKEGATLAAASTGAAAQRRPLPPPPAELFEYVRPGTREGVLAALGTARRSAGRPLEELMRTAVAAERDGLRDFLAREPASEMSDVEVAVCRTLPILPLHEDGLGAARALVGAAVVTAASASTVGSQTARKSGSGGGGAYAAADAGPLYLLLEAGTGFVGVESKGFVGDNAPATVATGATPASPQKWLESHLFTPSFLKVGGSGAGREGAAEAALAERLGVRLIGRAAFFVDHVFPRIGELPNGLRDAAMVEALLAAPRLSQQHERFRGALAELEFVPTTSKTGKLVRPREAFDPEVPELPSLLPATRFPDAVFRQKDVLAALRPLGLQGALGWAGLVEAASSVQAMGADDGDRGAADKYGGGRGARERGRALLTYLDTHEARLFDLKKETSGLFRRMAKLVYTDPAAEERGRERLAALHKLMALSWVPVLASFPSPLVPPTVRNKDSDKHERGGGPAISLPGTGQGRGQGQVGNGVVSPSRVRLREDMWVSSRTFYVLDAEVRSSAVRQAFSWDTPVDPVVVARQVTGLAETYSSARETLEAESAAAAAGDTNTETKTPPGKNGANAHTLEGHRQTMAGVVPRLYQLLSNAVEADDARARSQESGGSGSGSGGNPGKGVATEGIRAVLHGKPWLWVGDAFVPADQVAFTSPANAAPYLYAVPPDLACFATLLKRFGVRPSFGPSDFCHALRRLAVETGAAEPAVAPVSAAVVDSGGGGGGMVESLVALAGFKGQGADGRDGRGGVRVDGSSGGGGGERVARELSPAQVELAVAMVQVLSDESIRVSDLEVWVPDAFGVLALSTALLYDDAPWLTKQGHAPSAVSKGKPARFVHPKVSMAVGEKVGVGSLRRSMVDQSLTRLDFGVGAGVGESFGQQESLTRRLKHILQMYPEGPSILSELVQNADDAGARTVKVMLNTKEYGDGSLLSPAMSNWQGPSLYVYNDAVFTERDFQNLAKIGQASKLDKLAATGRFGLGFNAVYHFTDLPSFVSGEHLVMFDPHTKYVPGATHVQPGIKIKVKDTDLLDQFPDQFSPYLFFGCELKKHFNGTLFRFPLRTAAAARDSEISHASYSPESVKELLKQFKEQANRYLLFLRHVERIEVYALAGQDDAPVLQYSVEVTKRNPPTGWSAVPSFVSGPPRRPLSKEAFYSKLGQTPDAALPKVEQMVTITSREEGAARQRPRRGGGVVISAGESSSDSDGEVSVDVGGGGGDKDLKELTSVGGGGGAVAGGGDGHGRGAGGLVVGSAAAAAAAGNGFEKEADGNNGPTSVVDVFLVCAAIGGGAAKKMACLAEHRHMKLIPWGGVAAHISRNSHPPPPFEGHAFCFLPLPVNTLLPVHVNGFFELSSNRRDIWFGEDMQGEGKRRSEWNNLLLRDVIAPIYAALVARARDVMHAGPQHQALLPAADTPKPWETVVAATYANLKGVPVLYSRSATGVRGRWVCPGEAVVVEEVEEDGGGGTEERVEHAKRLTKILLWDRLPVVRLPGSLKKTMLHYNCLAADATPLFLRQHFGRADVPHPCLGVDAGGRFAPSPSSAITGGGGGRGGGGGGGGDGGGGGSMRFRAPASRVEAKRNAIFLLEAASTGLGKGESYGALVGLPLLPLANGTLGRFLAPPPAAAAAGDGGDDDDELGGGGGGSGGGGRGGGWSNIPRSENTVFVCTRSERRLLAGEGLGGEGGGAGHRLLENLEDLGQPAKALLNNKRLHAATNVAVMEPRDLAGMLGAVFPEAWQGLPQVAWAPGSRDVRPKQPSEDWVSSLWDYICKSGGSGGGSGSGGGGGGRGRTDRDPAETVRLFERSWPLLPATGGVGSDEIRVLMELHPGMPVVSPLAEGLGARAMSPSMVKVLSQLGVWILDAPALGKQARNPMVLKYANACSPSGVLSALQQALFPSAPAPHGDIASSALFPQSGGGGGGAELQRDFGPGGAARRSVDHRFQSVLPAERNALRNFLSGLQRSGEQLTAQQTELLKGLPIYRVHGGGSAAAKGGGGRGRRTEVYFTSISGAERLLLAPKSTDPDLLGPTFAVEERGDTELLESLGVERVGKGVFFREHVLPGAAGTRGVERGLPLGASQAAVVSVLSNLQDLCAEDPSLEAALREAQIVIDGGGEPAQVSDLFDPAVDELLGLLGPEAFPAEAFCTPAALAGMRSLGLQISLTCDGVLQSARSIEAAFAPPVASIAGVHPAAGASGGSGAASAAVAAAARAAAVCRSRKLLNFVDHRADQLLLASGESGKWFVDPRSSAAAATQNSRGSGGDNDRIGGAGAAGEEKGQEYLSSSGSESDFEDGDGGSEDGEGEGDGQDGGGVHAREARGAAAAARRERRREKEERSRMREAAAAASRPPPHNEFVEELASIAWLPVHGRAPSDLLPWKVQGPNSRQESVVVAAPCYARPESDQWFCSLRLGVLEGDVKSRSLKRAFGWDRPVQGLVLAVQLVSLSKKFEKLTIVAQKAEMKRKLATVTPEIYNGLDLIVDSPEFNQVKATLSGREWLWVGDKFLGSNRVAFKVPVAAGNILSSVPVELRGYETLLSALGVPKEFSPANFVEVLQKIEAKAGGRPLDADTLATAVGFVKILSQLSAVDRSTIKSEAILLPDKNGPILFPASSLVYDDAPWLSSRIRKLRLVHPDVGDEAAKSLGVRGLREAFLNSQGGTQPMPCPIAREIGEILGLSPGAGDNRAVASSVDTGAAGGGSKAAGGSSGRARGGRSSSSPGDRWLHDVMEVAETMKAERMEIILDEKEYEQQSLLHPALADTQGPSVCIVLPGTVLTAKQLLRMLSPPVQPLGNEAGGGGLGRPRMGNSVAALFALTDCLQVLSHDSLFVFDPCGEYLFTGPDPQTTATTTTTATDGQQQAGGFPAASFNTGAAARTNRRPSSASSAGSSSSTSPASSFYIPTASTGGGGGGSGGGSNSASASASGDHQQIPRPRSAFSSSSSSSQAGAYRTVTGVGGAGTKGRRSSGGGGGGGGRQRATGVKPRRDPIGRSYVVTREDVLNQFPHQYAPFLALPGGLGETIGEGLTSGRGYQGTVFRMSLRTRPGDISGSKCTAAAVERELARFSEPASAGLVMSHFLTSVHASVRRTGPSGGDCAVVDEIFSSRLRGMNGRLKRRGATNDAEWRKSSLNNYIRGFPAPRGTYNIRVCTTARAEERREIGGSSGARGAGGRKEGPQGPRRLEEVEDLWVLSYVLAPPEARKLALSADFEAEYLTPLLTCASLVSRSLTVNGQRSAQEPPAVRGRLFVGQNSSVRTGLPFHVDGPFFVSRRGGKASLVMDSSDNNRASLASRAPQLALGKWNKELFGSVCTELVPEHLVDLKDELNGHDAALLYNFWPSAKRAKMPFSIMLPGQMYLRLGELPLFLSRSMLDGGFKCMKDGYFKTQAISPLVEEYIRRHANLFSVPHTVTEDLARQPTVTVKKITPASVREFLRRSHGGSHADVGRVVEFFGGGGGSGGGGASGSAGHAGSSGGGSGGRSGGGGRQSQSHSSPRSGARGSAPPPDTGLLLELLEFCLSDCSPPSGERPPEVATAVATAPATAGGGVEVGGAEGGAGAAGGGQGQAQPQGAAAEDVAEVAAWSSREAQEARLAVAQWQSALDKCKAVWKELRGVPLLPLANGTAGSFPSSTFMLGGGKKYVLATRRQQGLLPQLKDRFVHLKATRRLARFFEHDSFLEMMGIVRFSPALLADNLHQVLPRGWKGEKFVGWGGGSAGAPGGAGGGGGGPKAPWLALFWSEVSLLDVASVPGLGQWPLVPITTGELVSCSLLQQIVRACPSMLNEVKMRGLGVALAAVNRSENAADERDEKELQDMLAQRRQDLAREAPVAESDDDDDEDDKDEDDQDQEIDIDEDILLLDLVDGVKDGSEEQGERNKKGGGQERKRNNRPETTASGAGGAGEASSGVGSEDELESVGDASLDLLTAHSPEAAAASASATTASPQGQHQGQGQAHGLPAGANASVVAGMPPGPPGPPSQPLANVAPPPPPSAAAVAAGAGAGAPRAQQQQGLVSALSAVAAAAVAAGQRAADVAAPAAPAPASATARAAAAAPGPVPEPPRLKTLVAVLRRLGVPVLELAFFPTEQRSWLVVSDPNEAARGALAATHALRNTLAPPYPISEACEARRAAAVEGAEGEAMAAMAELIASGEDHARDGRGRKLRLRWGALKPEEMDALLQGLSKPSDSSPPIAFPSSELDKLRDLPVWKTLSGKRVAVDRNRHFSLAAGGDVADLPLPPGASDRLLAPAPELSDLIRDIGVEQVDHPGVVARFVLPELGTVPPDDRHKLLLHVRSNWPELKQNQALVDQFKEVAFIPVNGVPTKASKLFDPRTEVLKEIFGDEPDAFPPGEFGEEAWLDVLVDVGLRNKLDRETILQCARKVESQRAEPLPAAVAERASLLMRHINSAAGEGELYNNEFLSSLGRLRFVPVHLPPPASRPDDDDDAVFAAEAAGGSGGGGGGGGDEAWSGGVVLLRFEEAAVPKDRNLVFTAFPVHMAGLVPPQLFWSLLKIRSPPPLEVVLRHMKIITDREHSQLDRWRYPQTPVKVFQSMFEFLEENWSKLSPGVMRGLKDRPLVPVGARLIKAGRLFFRLKENLSPFMFEVPRAFGAFDSLFKNLGTTQSPTASDYAIFLKELAGECGSQALNPNELGAVLKVLSLLAAELELDAGGNLSTDIYVPDESSELVPWGLCLYNDSPSLSGRVDPSRLRCLHPRVSLEDCRRLRIPSVSQVVKEELELGFRPEMVRGPDADAAQAQLSATLSSKDLSLAVAMLVKSFSPEDASVGIDVDSAAGGNGNGKAGASGTFEARANAAAARLEGFSVVFVKEVRSRFLRIGDRADGVGGEEDITAANAATGSVFFVREMNKTILVALGVLPDAFPPSYAVALAVAKLVNLPPAAVGPLSVLLATKPDRVESCLRVLQVSSREGATSGDELARGLPGEPLTKGDMNLLELKPLKAFLPGEVVAWEDKGASSLSPSSSIAGTAPSGGKGVLRYGVVVVAGGGAAEAGGGAGGEGAAGGDDEDFGGERGSGRVGGGLRHVKVKLTPGRVDTLLSSQVYSFRQARAGAAPSPGIAAHAAKMLRRIAGEDDRDEDSRPGARGAEESKGGGSGDGGGGGVVGSAQLLDAVNDILGRADLSLSVEQGARLKESLRHKEEARVAQAALAKAAAEAERLERRLKRMDKAFVCSICCTNDVDTVLATCGHMMCSSCMGSITRRECPFCRERWTATATFRRPGAEDVSDDEDEEG